MSVCARCPAVLGRSCCEVAQDEKLATLTEADVVRIRSATGRSRESFVDEDILDVETAHAYERARPLYAGYFRRAPIRLTLARRDGACVFLSRATGCTLDEATRPTACLLYPFEPWGDEAPTLLVEKHGSLQHAAREGGCLAVEEASSLEELREVFGMTPERLARWGERLRTEVQAHALSPEWSETPARNGRFHRPRRLR